MIDIKKEGYVAVQNNKIPLRNYLFYLTYGNRASVKNNISEVDLSSKDIYGVAAGYSNKINKEFSRETGMDKGEMVMSFSPELCALSTKHRFKNNLEDFKKDFEAKVTEILNTHLEQKEYATFIHEYDSTQKRVHAHIIFYPYVDTKENIKVGEEIKKIKIPRVWVEPNRLEKIKKDFNNYARNLYSGLEGMEEEVISGSNNTATDEDIMTLLRLSPAEKPIYSKEDAEKVLPKSTYGSINEKIQLLKETLDDDVIDTKKDWSQIVDYIYDFDDEEVKSLFFNHPAIDKIIKSFSLNKSVGKYSTTFLKLMRVTKDQALLKIILNKLKSNKAQEVRNIVLEEFSKDFEERPRHRTRTQSLYKT